MKDLAGRVALVTGSATGLGREIVTRLAERGADVIINYSRSAAEAEETADMCREHGSQAEIVKANVAEPEDCKALAEAAARRGAGGSTSSSTMPASPATPATTATSTRSPRTTSWRCGR